MREEYQKSIILVSMILIFGSLYGSSFFDQGSMRHNNIILFSILTASVMIGYLQTKKIKEWKEDKKTDYILVYWSYISFTIALFLYLIYMVVTRSELECMRLIKISMTHGMYKVYYRGGNAINNLKNYNNLKSVKKLKQLGKSKLANLKGGSGGSGGGGGIVGGGVSSVITNNSEIRNITDNIGLDANQLTQKESILKNITVSGAMGKIFNGYKKIWKKILFIKD